MYNFEYIIFKKDCNQCENKEPHKSYCLHMEIGYFLFFDLWDIFTGFLLQSPSPPPSPHFHNTGTYRS